jgi:putative ABC transport system permease protein
LDNILGLPINTLFFALLIVFCLIAAVIVVLIWRNRVIFKLGIRNVPKRPAQTALIIVGLMLSTIIISAAFGTGDTINYTYKSLVTESLGNADEIIVGSAGANVTNTTFFHYSIYTKLAEEVSGYNKIDGLLPLIRENAPLVNMANMQSESGITVFAPEPGEYTTFTDLTDENGQPASLNELSSNEVFLDQTTTEDLKVKPGDKLTLYLGGKPQIVTLKSTVKDASTGNSQFLIMPLSTAQCILGQPGNINAIYVSNTGNQIGGAVYTDNVKTYLNRFLTENDMVISNTKESILQSVNQDASSFTTIFMSFGLFSIAAGILLIFLIFMMLAAARKPEMGIARAIGTKRGHLVQMFLFEGVTYDIGAAAIGALLGIAVTWGMVDVMSQVFSTGGGIVFHIEPRSLVISFILGILVTFCTILFASWRVSHLNIVRAIRDLPEPIAKRKGKGGLVLNIVTLVAGLLILAAGIASKEGALLYVGVCLTVIGLALLAKRFGLKERAAFSMAGLLILAWSLMPIQAFSIFGQIKMGIDMFFIAGVMMVLGAVWVVIFNLDWIMRIVTFILGRFRDIVPALRTAVAYLWNNRVRTGMTLAMFSLVVFTIIFMSVIIAVNSASFKQADSYSGGYDIIGNVSYNSPIPDINSAINSAPALNANDFTAVAAETTLFPEMQQVGVSNQNWNKYVIRGVDNVFLNTNDFNLAVMAQGYKSAGDVWKAIEENPNLAVITADAVPSRDNFNINIGSQSFELTGLYIEDKTMSPIPLEVKDTATGTSINLTIIGVMQPGNMNYGVITSTANLQTLANGIPPTTYLFKLKAGLDAGKIAENINSTFLINGMQAKSVMDILQQASENSRTMDTLLQGFMSLGLLVGIAALGVISVRSVIERHHEIGMLRAIGFKQGTVRLSFLLESSVISFLGILIGVILALLLSYNVIDFMKNQLGGLQYSIPWLQILLISLGAFVASLLTTILPAHQAAATYPAESLRHE